jgi:hypothetical protein
VLSVPTIQIFDKKVLTPGLVLGLEKLIIEGDANELEKQSLTAV